jgi:hypothetical protein
MLVYNSIVNFITIDVATLPFANQHFILTLMSRSYNNTINPAARCARKTNPSGFA